MKRFHLFEFEDLSWFPGWLRECMTRYLVTLHKLFGTRDTLRPIVSKALKHSPNKQIVDLCSGGGGPMADVYADLRKEPANEELQLTFTDLYPNISAAKAINKDADKQFSYRSEPVDAGDVPDDLKGLRTMICSFHHMRPETAKSILKDARDSRQPICIYELSDNSYPKFLWWTAIPFSIIMVLFITPMVRPMTFQQIIFTYLIPILPLAIAWDGAVSNARTYTLGDLDILLEDLKTEDYIWEKDTVKGKGGKKIYLIGHVVST